MCNPVHTKSAHCNYAIEHIIENLKPISTYVKGTLEIIKELKDKGYSLICWSSIHGWLAINYDVPDMNHADIYAFSGMDNEILEKAYENGDFDKEN